MLQDAFSRCCLPPSVVFEKVTEPKQYVIIGLLLMLIATAVIWTVVRCRHRGKQGPPSLYFECIGVGAAGAAGVVFHTTSDWRLLLSPQLACFVSAGWTRSSVKKAAVGMLCFGRVDGFVREGKSARGHCHRLSFGTV